MKLIVGLGNPGQEYIRTRHNMGFEVVQALAREAHSSFKEKGQFKSFLASGVVEAEQVKFLLPQTYMNLSGDAVKKVIDYFDIPIDQVLIVVDDVALAFGHLRLRYEGQSGGHNGLENIEMFLGTNCYSRLRVGVGAMPLGYTLDKWVLSSFSAEEIKTMPSVLQRASVAIKTWLVQPTENALNLVNGALSKPAIPVIEENKNSPVKGEETNYGTK